MMWPLARSNGGRISSVAALIAVETKALISAAGAAPEASASTAMVVIRSFCMTPTRSTRFEAFGLVDRSRRRRGQRLDQRYGCVHLLGASRNARRIGRDILERAGE